MSRSVFIPILLAAFFVAFFIDTSYFNVTGSIVMLSVGILLAILFFFYKDSNEDITRVYFRPIHIFILSFVIVFFQKPIDILLGYSFDYYKIGRMELMPEAVRLALLGLISFLLGYIKKDDRAIKQKEEGNGLLIASTTIYKVITSLFLLLILVAVPKNVLFGGYHSAGLNDSIYNYLSSWCGVFYCAFFIQYTINLKAEVRGRGWTIRQFLRDIGWWQNINMLIYVLIILNVGDRGPMIQVCVIYYIAYLSVTGICPSRKTILTGLIGAIIFVAFLGYTKKFRDNNSIFERVNTTWEANPYEDMDESVSPMTLELAGSYKCLSYSIEDIETFGNYGYGKYQLGYVLSCIPFASRFLELPGATSGYISHLIQGDFLTYGNGTSVIADFYLDAGLIGVIILMFAIGYIAKIFDLVLFSNKKASLFLYCAAFYVSYHYISIPRSYALLFLKYSIWITVIMYLHQRISNRRINIRRKDNSE